MAKHIKAALVAAFVVFVVAATGQFGSAFQAFASLGVPAGAASLAAVTFATTLLSSAIGGMLSKGLNATGANFGSKFATRAPTAPRQIIYGKCRVGGTFVHMETTGTDNHLFHAVIILAGHEVESLESVRLNDVTLTTSSSTINSTTVFTVTNSEFTNTENDNNYGSGRLVRFCFEDGSQTASNAYAVAQSSLTTSDKFLDCAYVYIQMVFDPEKFGGGMPNMSFVVKGKKVFDPRNSSTAWSDNPALCIRDYLTDTTYGLKALSSEINDTTNQGGVAAAANACEVDVTLADNSSTEDKYTANGFTNFGASGSGVIEGLLSSMAGKMSYTNGQFNIFAGTTQTPSLTITDDNLLAPVTVATQGATGDLYNTVKPVYVDSTNNFVAADAPVYQDSTFLTEDTPNGTNSDKPNYVKQMEKQLPFTVTHTMAQRIGRLALKNQRFSTQISCLVDLSFMKLQPADWVYVTNERLSFSQKVFEVISVNMEVLQTEDVPVLGVRLSLKETDNSIFSFAVSDYQANIAAGSDLVSGTFQIAAPSNLSIASNTEVNDVYNTRVVVASWTNSASSLVSGTEVQFKRNSASNYSSMFAGNGATELSVGGLEVGQTYNFRVRHYGISGVRSAFTSVVNHTVTGSVVSVSSLDNSNTTKSDVGLDNVDNESSATIRGQETSGNHSGTVGGVANSTITVGAQRANERIDSSGRFTGDLTGNVRSNGTTKSPAELIDAHTRATAGLDSSGNVQRDVPAAQINNALVTVLNADSQIAQWISSDGSVYSPTSSNIDLTVTADNGTSKQSCTIRWSFVNVSNSTADYISACVEQADASNAFTLGSITDLSGNNVKSATCVVTHTASSETITLQALLSLTNVSGGGK